MKCEKEELLKQIQKDLYFGNGKASLMDRINTLESSMKHIKNLDANVEILMRYQTQQETRAAVGQESKTEKRWFVGMLITSLLSLGAMILNVLL